MSSRGQEQGVTVHWHLRLTAKNAVEIYKMKKHKTPKSAASMAAKYSVTPKAVRDIWTHVTWTTATWPFWTTKHQLNYSLT